MSTDVVARLWGFAHNLRHDGVDYGDYIEQITYVHFLKRTLDAAIRGFELLRAANVRTLRFTEADEAKAIELVRKYIDKTLSYHDALCASVMLRHRLFRIFSFDADFWTSASNSCPARPSPADGANGVTDSVQSMVC